MDYLYGKLNFEVERVDYTGVSSSTAKIDIDKKEATIKIDVIKTPNNLIIDNLEDNSITYFDGSKEIIIELPKVSDRVLQSEFDIFKTSVENDYNQKINAEEERALKAESELRTELNNVIANNYEELNNRISQEVNNILDGAPEQLNTLKEISEALNNNELLGSVVIQNQTDIANEITRATKAEADLNTLINDTIEDCSEEFNNFKQEVNQFAQVALQAIDSEVNRATKAEEELSATITNNKKAHDDEYDTFKGAVQASFDGVDSAIENETKRATTAEQKLSTDLTTGLSALEATTNKNLEDETTFDSGTLASVAVGGIAKGTDLSKYSVKELLENILCPYVEFSLNVSSVTPNNSPYEKGTSVNLTKVNVTVTKGSKNITSLKLYESDKTTLIGEITDVATNNTFTINKNVTSSVSFYAEATDGTKTKGDSSSFLSFYDPTFYGVLDVNYELNTENSALITNQNKKLLANKNNVSCSYTAKDQYPFFAYPASYGDLTSIVDSSNLDFTNDFNKTTMNLNVKSGTVSYNIYVLKNVTEVTNYTFIFK